MSVRVHCGALFVAVSGSSAARLRSVLDQAPRLDAGKTNRLHIAQGRSPSARAVRLVRCSASSSSAPNTDERPRTPRRPKSAPPRDAGPSTVAGRSGRKSLPEYLNDHAEASLLGFRVILENGDEIGVVIEVLSLADGEVVMQAKDMALAEAQPADEPAPEPWDGTGLASSAGADSSVLGEAPTDPEGGGGGAGAAGGRREPPEPLPLEEPAGAFLDDLLRSLAAAPGRGGAEEDESASGRTESTLIRIHMKGRGRPYEWDSFYPLATPLVPWVSGDQRVICISPPQGLLELGEQPHLVQWLKGRLEPYILTSPAPRGGTPHRRMPYESTLERAGERELVREIRRAGGFAAVALALGMRPSRRPVGFWEDLDNLALELAEFVFSAWVKLDDEDTGQTYFYNDLTGQISWSRPEPGETLLVVPSSRAVMAAGRFDLYNAIRHHDGHKAVAEALGWPRSERWAGRHLTDLDMLSAELADVQSELDGSADTPDGHDGDGPRPDAPTRMPTREELLSLEREDLVTAVIKQGGFIEVAQALGLEPNRAPPQEKTDRELLRDLRAFMRAAREAGRGGRGPPRLPSRRELRAAGRNDLALFLRRRGNAAIEKVLGLPAPVKFERGAARGGGSSGGEARASSSGGGEGPGAAGEGSEGADGGGPTKHPEYEAAREFARTLGLACRAEWRAWVRGPGQTLRPAYVPSVPDVTLRDSGWAGWADFLGREATGKSKRCKTRPAGSCSPRRAAAARQAAARGLP